VNVGVAHVNARDRLRLRVWERGAGLTLACGTGACAALAAAVKRELCDRRALVEVDGGMLDIEWSANNHLFMTGPVAETFSGALSPSLLQDATS
jgi:diaminopimelate epimerase